MSAETDYEPRVIVGQGLDGVAVQRSTTIHLLYRQILSEHDHLLTALDVAIERLPHQFAAVVPSRCDAVGSIVRMAGIPIRQTLQDHAIGAIAPVMVAGCSPNLPQHLPPGFFQRGGMLVTSGRTILDVPLPRDLMVTLPAAGPATVRIDVDGAASPTSLPIRLPAGHIPIRLPHPEDPRIHVIATARVSGDPIVLAVRIGAGWLLHSVAHWFQDEAPATMFTIDRCRDGRRVVPMAVERGREDAVRAMSAALLRGLCLVISSQPEISKL